MKSWKIVICHLKKTFEVVIEAKSNTEACASVERIYTGCIVKLITEINSKK